MIAAAEARGHVIDCIYTSRCYMAINAHKPEVHYDGKPLPRYDAIIPRIGTSLTFYGMAVVRQFESMGVYCLNNASAIGNSRDKLLAHQVLAAHRLGMPNTAFAKSSRDTKGIIDLVGGSPVVVKLLESTQGKGVVLAETRKAASALVDAFRGLDAVDVIRQIFPCGSITGAPKVRAMEIIDELEPEKRGVYGGGCGYFSANGDMDMCIALRTAVLQDEKLYIQAGGGVVYDSDPEAEYQETVHKSNAIRKAAADATMFRGNGN